MPFVSILCSIGLIFTLTSMANPQTLSLQLTDGIDDQVALKLLIDIGYKNRLPMGIVIQGESLCKQQLHLGSAPAIDDLMKAIEDQVPGYLGEIKQGVLIVRPKVMKPAAVSTLNLLMPTFKIPGSSFQDAGVALWMDIRVVLVPEQGSAFSGGALRNPDMIPGFETSNTTVQDILDILVSKSQGGLWTMQEVPPRWQSDPRTDPFALNSYLDERRDADKLTCVESWSLLVRLGNSGVRRPGSDLGPIREIPSANKIFG